MRWTWKFDNYGGRREVASETTPLMVDGVLYFTAGDRRVVVAADAGTGETLWIWRIDEGERYERAPRRNSGRGVSYWSDGENQRILVVTPGFRLAALDSDNGYTIEGFGDGDMVDLFGQLDLNFDEELIGKIGNTSPPVIARDVVVIGPSLLGVTFPFLIFWAEFFGFWPLRKERGLSVM